MGIPFSPFVRRCYCTSTLAWVLHVKKRKKKKNALATLRAHIRHSTAGRVLSYLFRLSQLIFVGQYRDSSKKGVLIGASSSHSHPHAHSRGNTLFFHHRKTSHHLLQADWSDGQLLGGHRVKLFMPHNGERERDRKERGAVCECLRY